MAGLVSSILLARHGIEVTLIERKSYPLHKVCGEYVSNEVLPFLRRHGLYPESFEPARIDRFLLSSISGKEASVGLPLGGFGISRYRFDHFLYEQAVESGVQFELNQLVDDIAAEGDHFRVSFGAGRQLDAGLVIGAFGKRSRLDMSLDRAFVKKRSPWLGVKYHIRTDFAHDTVALYNFPGGYCGLVKIEGDLYNLCYLSRRENLKVTGTIEAMEAEILQKNPSLRHIFSNSDFVNSKPEVINEISFEKKETAKQGVLMAGDSAGLITPLCGNGMAIAIHSASILSDIIIKSHTRAGFDREAIEKRYRHQWTDCFSSRLGAGRQTQNLFGSEFTSSLAVGLVRTMPRLARRIVSLTHGKEF